MTALSSPTGLPRAHAARAIRAASKRHRPVGNVTVTNRGCGDSEHLGKRGAGTCRRSYSSPRRRRRGRGSSAAQARPMAPRRTANRSAITGFVRDPISGLEGRRCPPRRRVGLGARDKHPRPDEQVEPAERSRSPIPLQRFAAVCAGRSPCERPCAPRHAGPRRRGRRPAAPTDGSGRCPRQGRCAAQRLCEQILALGRGRRPARSRRPGRRAEACARIRSRGVSAVIVPGASISTAPDPAGTAPPLWSSLSPCIRRLCELLGLVGLDVRVDHRREIAGSTWSRL